ncbi:aspartyl-tRNA(Asn)/glutamyl-tRNA(Gln) amidotransferase subunit A [Arthrobacter pascens]|uniref:amidase n=1 Tax=Arthrobacter pascens TaxID=1677 RepID=UPI00278E0237|nr:amidase [Arthrobacter pascens]MDQ0678934.1 aspartyl-tRNA(Asn)/glutamyl-tRNA(Gln) amidotransferase subunit A [Arthrobacter pascens]
MNTFPPHSSVMDSGVRSIADIQQAFDAGELTPSTLLESAIEHIHHHEPASTAFAQLALEQARVQAAEATQEIADGRRLGPLHGIPLGIKDMIDVAGLETTASSRVRAGRVATSDATVTSSLRAAGAIFVGKTHTHEFAYGLTTPSTRNPRDLDRIPGGSSGGSAAALAGGMVFGALGTDTGGSIRVPASLTGVIGLKPTFGLVPRTGVIPLAWSLDHVGPLAHTVNDAALLLEAMAGFDTEDPSSVHRAPIDYTALIGRDLTGIRVGVPRNFFFDRVADDVETATRAAIDRLAEHGAALVPVDVPSTTLFQPVQWGLMVSEASAYHANELRSVAHLYGDDVRILLEAGDHMLATDYIRALRARTIIIREWNTLFESIDMLATPSTPQTAALIGQENFEWTDGSTETVSDAYVRLAAPANLTGRPAISVPAGLDRTGLPIGFQLIGRPFEEATLFRAANVV